MQDRVYWDALLAASDAPAFVIDVAEGRFLASNSGANALWGLPRLQGTTADRAMPALARLRQLADANEGETDRASEPGIEPLVIWTTRGARRVMARYRRLSGPRALFLVEVQGARGGDAAAASHEGAAGWYGDGSASAVSESEVSAFDAAASDSEFDSSALVSPDPLPRRFSALDRLRGAATPKAGGAAAVDTGVAARMVEPTASDVGAAAVEAPRNDADTLREIARRIRAGSGQPAAPDLSPDDAPEITGSPPENSISGVASDRAAGRQRLELEAAASTRPPARQGRIPQVAITDPEGSPLASAGSAAALGAMQHGPVAAVDLARLAHELRTPISAIVAMAEIMRDERFGPLGDALYRGYARDMHESARHMLGVLNGMIEPGIVRETPRLEFTEIDVGESIARAVSAMRPLADRQGVELTARIGARLPRLIADKRSVRQMLFNLISNALKATPGGGTIEVEADHLREGQIRIDVRDSGQGMTAAEIVAVFRKAMPGTGAAATDPLLTKAHGEGGSRPPPHGYGLPLVRALAAANGAELRLESRVGEGTTASIVFAEQRVIPV